MTTEKLDQLERLSKLRDAGTLTAEEFDAEKAKLLSQTDHAPTYRRLWFVVLLTALVLTFPVALLILLTGDVYRKSGESEYRPIGRGSRFVYAGALGIWLAGAVILNFYSPDDIKRAWETKAVDRLATDNSKTSPTSQPAQAAAIAPSANNETSENRQTTVPSNTAASDEPDANDSPALKACFAHLSEDASRADNSDCYDQEYKAQHKLLGETYAALMGTLSPDKQLSLKLDERAWIKERDSKCADTGTTDMGNSTMDFTVSCDIDETVKRIAELQRMQN